MAKDISEKQELDFYFLYLYRYLRESHFPEADDSLLISTLADRAYSILEECLKAGEPFHQANEKALQTLCDSFTLSPHNFVSDLLEDEFADRIDTGEISLEYWTGVLMDTLADEFKNVELSPDFLDTAEGTAFRLTVIGRMELFFEEYGL